MLALAAYVFVFRRDMTLIPVTGAVVFGLDRIAVGIQGSYPGAGLGAALTVVSILALGTWWTSRQRQAASGAVIS